MVGFMLIIGLYLVITLAFPLYAMLSKSFSTFSFDLNNFEFQVNTGDGWSEPVTAFELNQQVQTVSSEELATSSDGRLPATVFFPDFNFRSTTLYRIRQLSSDAAYLVGTERVTDTEWHEFESNKFRRIVLRPSKATGLENYRTYFSTPALFRSIENSLFIATISTIITVTLAFGFAYALTRSTMRFKGFFRLVAMLPILVPSLLPGIAMVYLFGNQGMLKELLMGESIYGPIGIVIGSVFFTFPHAMIIIITALSIADSRLYESAIGLRASKPRIFFTVTIPGARYGLISAAFVVFTLTITDFGAPKVIGGDFNVLRGDRLGVVRGRHPVVERLHGDLRLRKLLTRPQRSRLDRAIVVEPRVLLLDEALAGLDDQVARTVIAAADELIDRGTTIVLATHVHDALSERCPNELLLDSGRIIARREAR